jgi:mono/diheme cytochrome c family protein
MVAGKPPKNMIQLEADPALVDPKESPTAAASSARAQKIATLFTWPGKIETVKAAPKAPPLTPSQQEFVAAGKVLYTAICAACHLPNGIGQEGLAPPLAASEWVTGSPDRLSRIVLHGLSGPIEVLGKTYTMDMPGLGPALSDEQIAQILSYIRRDWGHEATVVEPAAVAAVRAATKDRASSWTAAELQKIP